MVCGIKFVGLLCVFVVVSSLFCGLAFFAPEVYANSQSALVGWLYRKPINIVNATGASTNYQFQVYVWNSTGVSSGNNVTIGAKSLSVNFGDLRFTRSDATTLLSFWFEDVNSTTATCWVKVPDDLSSINRTIYLYYGKTGVATTSDGLNTFLFFDDFNDNSFNTSKWTVVSGTGFEESGHLIANGTNTRVRTTSAMTTSIRLRYRQITNNVSGYSSGLQRSDATHHAVFNASTSNITTFVSPNWLRTPYNVTSANSYSIHEIDWRTNTNTMFHINNTFIVNHTSIVSSLLQYPFLEQGYGVNPTVRWDWVMVSKYLIIEPYISDSGAEEIWSTPTYSPATKTITVLGNSSNNMSRGWSFDDLWIADKDGELVMSTRTNINQVNVTAHNFTYAIRPTDYYVLGGVSNDLWVNVSSWTGLTNATITLVGTNSVGSILHENITVTGNGLYYCKNVFRTMYASNITGFTGTGSFSFSVTQGQWGVVWKQGTNQYQLECFIVIGNGTQQTHFWDIDKQIIFSATTRTTSDQRLISVQKLATFQLGVLQNATTKQTGQGCQITDLTPSTSFWGNLIYPVVDDITAQILLYSCTFLGLTAESWWQATQAYNINCNGRAYPHVSVYNTVPQDYFNIVISGSGTTGAGFGFRRPRTTTTLNNLFILVPSHKIWFQSFGGTVKNILFRGVGTTVRMESVNTDCYIINADDGGVPWSFSWVTSVGRLFRQYEFDLVLTNSADVPLQNCNVTLAMANGTQITNIATNSSGQIPTQTLTYGFYNSANGDNLQSAAFSPYNLTIYDFSGSYLNYTTTFTPLSKTNLRIALTNRTALGLPYIGAAFTYSPANPAINQTVLFNASMSIANRPIINYAWDFGDGRKVSSNNSTITHSFKANSTYHVNMTVTSLDGSASIMTPVVVGWGENLSLIMPYIASAFMYSPTSPVANSSIYFSAMNISSSPITNYVWEWGDGNVTSGNYPNPSYVYATNGSYLCKLTVSNQIGNAFIVIPVSVGATYMVASVTNYGVAVAFLLFGLVIGAMLIVFALRKKLQHKSGYFVPTPYENY